MYLKQYYLGCLAHASYLIADERTGQAAVVDPQRDVEQYLDDARAAGYDIKYVILTHFHADFLAGHIELRNRASAKIVMGARAQAEFEVLSVNDGDSLDLGDVRLQIMETPGHTPEGISVLVFDKTHSDTEPHAVLTGDTLFIGDVGRPDLLASIGVTADELADMLSVARHHARIPCSRCRFNVWKEPQQRNRFHNWRTEEIQLRIATNGSCGVQGTRHGRST